MFKLGNYYIFYRHFLYGSALGVGTYIGMLGKSIGFLSGAFFAASAMMILSSAIVTVTVNNYPEEFIEELRDFTDDEEES